MTALLAQSCSLKKTKNRRDGNWLSCSQVQVFLCRLPPTHHHHPTPNCDEIHFLKKKKKTLASCLCLWTVTLRSRKPSGRRSLTSPPSQNPSLRPPPRHSSSRCHGSRMRGRRPRSDNSPHPWRYRLTFPAKPYDINDVDQQEGSGKDRLRLVLLRSVV